MGHQMSGQVNPILPGGSVSDPSLGQKKGIPVAVCHTAMHYRNAFFLCFLYGNCDLQWPEGVSADTLQSRILCIL